MTNGEGAERAERDGDDATGEALRLFERALELDAAERARFVAEAAADRPDLRREVEALLAIEQEGAAMPRLAATGTFVDTLLDELGDLAPGTVVGSFRVESALGRGGMGAVYVAVQEQPKRRVALKTLARGLHAADTRRRFQVEGELLGHLQHPGIAQVFETGVARVRDGERETELPYIAMELLEGARPLVEHADAARLDLRARVRLVAAIARAIHYAHQRGVIHRDLKPANLLVDALGHPRVIDFGIAFAAEADLDTTGVRTLDGQLLGTPAYMSPEQLTLPSHELDTRADVYALGAVAYELCCGKPPFAGGERPLGALVREITTDGAPRPRSVRPDLPRDLDAILVRALEIDRDERYASAAALADDLERFLRHEPVEAKAPTLGHQVRLFARRNRLFATSVVVAAASLLVATIVSLGFAWQAHRAAEAERVARERADAFLAELFDENLTLVFDFAEQAGAVRGGAALRVRMLESASARLEELEEETGGDPELVASLARAYVRLGDALGSLNQTNAGDLEGADRAYRRAEELLAAAGSEEPLLARGWIDLEQARGDQARGAGDFDRAREHYERAIALGEEALDAHPDSTGLRSDVLKRLRDLGNTFGSLGEHGRALDLFEEVAGGWEAMRVDFPSDPAVRTNLANTQASIGSATLRHVGPRESLASFRAALDGFEAVERDFPGYRQAEANRVGVRHAYTEALIQAGELDAAEDEALAALDLAKGLLVDDPGDVQLLRWSGLIAYNAGWALQERAAASRAADPEAARADLAGAREHFERALAVFENLRDAGQLLPIEAGHPAAIGRRLDAVEAELASLP